jgi:D-arabinose 1-dehydrogenase-like Zn-dependent alcohol dehydrogenase
VLTPEPCAGEVRVRIELAGVCGTDLHPRRDILRTFPLTPGHEMVGIAESMGPGVTGLALGAGRRQRQMLRACAFCNEGRPLQCTALSALGTGPGGFAEAC